MAVAISVTLLEKRGEKGEEKKGMRSGRGERSNQSTQLRDVTPNPRGLS